MANWFEDEVRELERRPLPEDTRNLVLFYGSSSFTLWEDMPRWFPGYNILNRGFGGSTLADCLEFFDRLVVPVSPKAILLYAGDNDLDQGVGPEELIRYLRTFIARKRQALGDTPMAYLSVKLSVARLHLMHKFAYTNYAVERFLADQEDVDFINIFRRMSGRGIAPFRRYYTHDDLHMNAHGYCLWSAAINDYLTDLDRRLGGGLKVRPEAEESARRAVCETSLAEARARAEAARQAEAVPKAAAAE